MDPDKRFFIALQHMWRLKFFNRKQYRGHHTLNIVNTIAIEIIIKLTKPNLHFLRALARPESFQPWGNVAIKYCWCRTQRLGAHNKHCPARKYVKLLTYL